MKIKNLLKALAITIPFGLSLEAQAQQWSPSSSYTDQSTIGRIGNVGIGTTTPGANLEVKANDNPLIVLNSSVASIRLAVASCNTCYSSLSITNDALLTTGSSAANLLLRSNTAGRSIKFITRDASSNENLGMELAHNGNLGIGTITTPSAKLEIATYDGVPLVMNRLNGSKSEIMFRAQGVTKWTLGNDPNANNQNEFFIWNASASNIPLSINSSSQVKIGQSSPLSSHPDYKLGVDGKLVAKSIYVTTTGWADYVFANDYKLTPLSEVEAFVKEYKHLPEIPSTAEVMKQGIDVAKMDALLLKKVEELTLHMIELQKQNENLKSRIQTLEKR